MVLPNGGRVGSRRPIRTAWKDEMIFSSGFRFVQPWIYWLGSLDILEAIDDLGNLEDLDSLEYLVPLDIISDLYAKKPKSQCPNVLGWYDMNGNVMEWC